MNENDKGNAGRGGVERSPIQLPVVAPSPFSGEVQSKRTLERSPPYPAVNLKQALEYAQMFRQHESRNSAPATVAYQHWGFSQKSSGGRLALSALVKFGLLDEEGRGAERRVKLSRLALDILLDDRPESSERAVALKRAALAPAIHAELWRKWGAELPSEANLRTYLVKDREFNESAVDDFIREYKDTIDYAKMGEGDTIPSEQSDGRPNGKSPPPQKGDFVQWSRQGADQFPEPRRIVGISDDGQWVYIDGTPNGVPVSEVVLSKPKNSSQQGGEVIPPPNPLYSSTPAASIQLRAGSIEDKTNLDEGPVILHWPADLSPASVEELEYWFEGLIRRARRKAGLPRDPNQPQ